MSHKHHHIFPNSPDFQESFWLSCKFTPSYWTNGFKQTPIQTEFHLSGPEKPMIKDILLQKHNTRGKIRKFHIDAILLSKWTVHIQISVSGSESNLGSHVAFSCHVPLMPFSLEQVLIVSLSSVTLTFLKSPVSFFVDCSLIQISLMFYYN